MLGAITRRPATKGALDAKIACFVALGCTVLPIVSVGRSLAALHCRARSWSGSPLWLLRIRGISGIRRREPAPPRSPQLALSFSLSRPTSKGSHVACRQGSDAQSTSEARLHAASRVVPVSAPKNRSPRRTSPRHGKCQVAPQRGLALWPTVSAVPTLQRAGDASLRAHR